MRSRVISVHLYRRGWLFCLVVAAVLLAAMAWFPSAVMVAPPAQWMFAAVVLSIATVQFLRHPPKFTMALMHGFVDWKYGYVAWWNPASGPASLAEDSEMEAPSTWDPALVIPHARWRPVLAAASRALWVLTVPLSTLLALEAFHSLIVGSPISVPDGVDKTAVLAFFAAGHLVVLAICWLFSEVLLLLSTLGLGAPGVPRRVAHRAALHAFSKTAGFMHPDTGRIHHATPHPST